MVSGVVLRPHSRQTLGEQRDGAKTWTYATAPENQMNET